MYLVGKILKPQGRYGEVKVEIITSFPEHFSSLETLFIKKNDDWLGFSVENVRVLERFAFIKLVGVDSIDQAELFRGEYLFIPEDDLKDLDKNEFFIHDLIGMQVFDESGTLLGKIVDVELLPANDIYTVELLNGSMHAIPAISEVVKIVDIENTKMTIHVLAGLFD